MTQAPDGAGRAAQDALVAMAQRVGDLPLLPQVLVRILQLDADADDYFEAVERLASEDPPFAVRLLAVANSAQSAPVDGIRSIREALTRVGAVTISRLVASLAVQRVFMPSSAEQVGLWHHSIRVAVAAETLAELAPALALESGEAYLAGLLHDVGRFVMFEHAPEALRRVDEANWSTPDDLVAADMAVFTYTHSELGGMACERWGLPDALAEAVRRHHEILRGPVRAGGTDAMVLCLAVADRLDLAVLDDAAMSGAPTADVEAEIRSRCLWSRETRALVDAGRLAAAVPAVCQRAATVIASLGL